MNVVIGGDFYPGGKVEPHAIRRPREVWGDIIDELERADLRIVNLECPLTVAETPIRKTGPNLKAHPDTIQCLRTASIDVVTLANNHVYDYGEKGLGDTLDVCVQHGIATVGAGLTLSTACEPLVMQVAGQRLAIVNFSENEWCNAGRSTGGANPYDVVECARQIHRARDEADIVLVIIHGGHELFHYPSPRMVKDYRFFAEQGASAIVCHHTHCVSGFEVHNEVPIFYSLGNLLFDSETRFAGWYVGFLVILNFDGGEVSWEIVPYEQSKPRSGIWKMPERKQQTFREELTKMGAAISDASALQALWEEFVDSRSATYLAHAAAPRMFVARLINRLRCARYLPRVLDFRVLHNYIRCESHRDVLLSVFDSVHARVEK